MKKRTWWATVAAVGILVGAASSEAVAGTIKVVRSTSATTGYSGVAGEFKVTELTGMSPPAMAANAALPGGIFQTFCLEKNNGIATNTTYNWTLNTAAVDGGGGAVGGSDPLSSQTAYLYTQFWNGALNGYTYTLGSGRTASATDLQTAIWYLEEEYTGGKTATNFNNLSQQAQDWVTEAESAVSSGAWTGLRSVRVLNLTDASGADIQDLLVMVPLPPAAMAGFLLFGGLGLLGRVKKRKKTPA